MYLKIICQTPMRIKCFNFKHFFLQSSSPPQGKVWKKTIIASWRKQKFLIRVVGENFLSKHIANKQITKNKLVPIFHSKSEDLLHRVCHCSSHVYYELASLWWQFITMMKIDDCDEGFFIVSQLWWTVLILIEIHHFYEHWSLWWEFIIMINIHQYDDNYLYQIHHFDEVRSS